MQEDKHQNTLRLLKILCLKALIKKGLSNSLKESFSNFITQDLSAYLPDLNKMILD